MNYIKANIQSILSIHRLFKILIAIVTDIVLCILCTWFAFVLRLEELILLKNFNFYPAIISCIIAIPIFWIFGLYKIIFRYTGASIILTIFSSICIYGLLYTLVISVYGITDVPRSVGILQPILLLFAVTSSRLLVKFLLTHEYNFSNLSVKKNVLIYGAGEAGRQLFYALQNSLEFKVVGFFDDKTELQRQVILGQTIYSPLELEKLIKKKKINSVFLALPSVSRHKRNQIIDYLSKYKLVVKTLPSILEIIDGKIMISDIRDLNIDDLLNRDQVLPDKYLLDKNIKNKSVLVTGAGGSIGSELCRQIIRLEPKKLLLVEFNEFALYKIYEELIAYNKNFKIIPLLVNIQDQLKLELIFETFNVDTVYHAAAYKHVSLVEENICESVKNNVFGTLALAKASISKKVLNFVLISSDKAVKPTNIMGATKRLSELCIQSICNNGKNININFSIVRFGNVLESSGSVIPKFKKQIKEGGPVTLTDKDVTRYFMTITEAAQLVIQAGAMSKQAEIFLLDMGQSVKIKDLIYKIINLSGFSVKDEKNPTGDIEIKVIGLRPGEKLYEELLIGDSPHKTSHSKIFKTKDIFIPFTELEENLNNLKKSIDRYNAHEVKKLLEKIIKLYKSNSKLIDHIHVEQTIAEKLRKSSSTIDEKKV